MAKAYIHISNLNDTYITHGDVSTLFHGHIALLGKVSQIIVSIATLMT